MAETIDKKIPINVYSESTPNPATMKFVSNKLFVPGDEVVEFTGPEQTREAPLAARLFTFPFVEGVFFAKNFVTITKNDAVDWMDITAELREYIINYLTAGHAVFTADPTVGKDEDGEGNQGNKPTLPQNEMEEKIVQILEEYVRPPVESDGGAIHFKSFNSGKLIVTLKGACSGCPSSTVTLKNGIEALFQRMLPEVKEVVAEEG